MIISTGCLQNYLAYAEIKNLIQRIESMRGVMGTGSFTVLSELPGEGRSFFSAVLAAGLVGLGSNRRCLVVDASAHFPEPSYLLNQLMEPLERVDVVRLRDNEAALAGILEGAQGRYENVIVDTCALSLRNKNNLDPILLARQTGGALFLNSPLSLGEEKAEIGRRRLAESGIKLHGIVHNEWETQKNVQAHS
jgi:Mrp family chromosome partitioning ATPase